MLSETLMDATSPVWLKFFIRVRVCEKRKYLEAHISIVLESRDICAHFLLKYLTSKKISKTVQFKKKNSASDFRRFAIFFTFFFFIFFHIKKLKEFSWETKSGYPPPFHQKKIFFFFLSWIIIIIMNEIMKRPRDDIPRPPWEEG